MPKSTLSIRIPGHSPISGDHFRTIEVPCRLPEAFTIRFAAKGSRWGATAYVADGKISDVETNEAVREEAQELVDATWLTILAALGITGPVPPGSPLPAIALAYDAECAAYEACVKAHAALPRELHSPALIKAHPGDRDYRYKGDAALLLAKYVAYVVEQAAKVAP